MRNMARLLSFVIVFATAATSASAQSGVTSIGGVSGAIALNSGLSMVGSTLTSVWSLTGGVINTSSKVAIGGLAVSTAPDMGVGSVSSLTGFFKNGRPWADVRAWGAKGDSTTDDTAAIQNAINYMSTNFDGGIVFFSPGSYKVTSTLTVNKGIILMGSGRRTTAISSAGADITVLNVGVAPFTGNDGIGIEKLFILGNATTSSTSAVVVINANVSGYMRDCQILGGKFAIYTGGVDFTYDNNDVASRGTSSGGANIFSYGGGWYIRMKIDNITAVTYGFFQGWNGSTAAAENHFMQSDFTGPWTNAAIRIDDQGHNSNITIFEGSVVGPQGTGGGVEIDNARHTSIVGGELGGVVNLGNLGGTIAITGTTGFSGVTVSGGSTHACAANINVTC